MARGDPQTSVTLAAVHLFGLCGFAIAQPLFEVLAGHSAFFVAHGASSSDVIALALGIAVAPAWVAWLCVALPGAISPALRWLAQIAAVAVLLAAALLPPLVRALPLADPIVVGVALGGGIIGSTLYARRAVVRAFATLSGAAPVLFVSLFLFTEPVSRLVMPPAQLPGAVVERASDAPIVVLVLDELPLSSLLDARGKIDAQRFPGFGRLAREATWYPDARTVYTTTIHSLPAIVTGRVPPAASLPWAADHPENLFALLEGTHELHVFESETLLHAASGADPTRGSLGALASDASLVYLHILLPESLRTSLPSVSGAWQRFARPPNLGFAELAADAVWGDNRERIERFDEFVDSIGRCERRCLHFLHTALPHRPWQYTPSGRRYVPATLDGLDEQERWSEDAWRVAQGQQRHLLQTLAVDRLVQQMLTRLDASGVYDRALVFVLADHGASFWPGESLRWLEGHAHPEDIVRVPLFVKAPGQRAGSVDRRSTLTIDVVPTLADWIDVELPWSVDGCSLRAEPCAAPGRQLARRRDHQPVELPGDLAQRRASLERRLGLFGEGDASLYAFGEHADLVGRRAAELHVRAAVPPLDWTLRVARAGIDALARDPQQSAYARASGYLRSREHTPAADARPHVAVAVDGVVQAVAPSFPHAAGSLAFSAMLPELSAGEHRLDLYLVRGSGRRARLQLAHSERIEVPGA